MLQLVLGDLLEVKTQYLAHQCNCITKTARGLAAQVFDTYPEANVYKKRSHPSTLGTIQVVGRVINMFAQYEPGAPGFETRASRLEAFRKCLVDIEQLPELQSIAFPYGIGCGLARGYWTDYQTVLEEFSSRLPQVQVFLVKEP